jgi:GH25 family lysozyme M1 (1,4-beta-N-acetylmuramidase)
MTNIEASKSSESILVNEITAYIHHHPLRIITGIVCVFGVLITLFFLQKKGPKKWLILTVLIVFIPFAFRIVRMTPVKKIHFFTAVEDYENLDKSSFEKNGIRTFGLDISHHQGYIDWDSVAASKHPIQFIFIRATNGTRILDREFHRNWEESRGKSFLRGVYHYYRPSQNSTNQFNFFKSHVYLRKGDLPPVLDMEDNSWFGRDNLLRGVKNWLALAEKHYGVKPIIYTNRDFYLRYFNTKDFKPYHFWIAAYSGRQRVADIPWTFHQYTEQMYVKGIEGKVDGDDFNGDRKALEKLTIR